MKADLVVMGSGPGGYTAAFRAADLGKRVVLIERFPTLGGVCLNVGCIPSKALLHVAKVVEEAREIAAHGVAFSEPSFDREKLVAWKNSVVNKLTGGLNALSKQRKVEIVTGNATFSGPHQVVVATKEGNTVIDFENAIIAVGSESVKLPFIPEDSRIFSSTGALELADIKGDLLVLGGGIIGLEMATVYSALGVKVTVVEFMDQLIPGADADLVAVLQKRLLKKGVNILLKTKVTAVDAKKDGILYEKASFPWVASGRALSVGREEGITKLLFCPKTKRVLGAGIVGVNAGELIAELALAIEMGCEAEDLALTIHPHPTLSETVAQAAELFEGSITDLYLPKKKEKA